MRFLTAGESHGEGIISIIEGFPKGVKIEAHFIDRELARRRSGYGRGKRMQIEEDKVEILSGIRNKITLGSPICMLVRNKDKKIFTQEKDFLPPLSVPRPGHADLAGCLKYEEKDIRNILERTSARETVSRVCIGAVCKQFLNNFNVNLGSFVVGVGKIISSYKPTSVREIIEKTASSKLNCIDREKEKLMIKEIEKAKAEGDTLGGIVEVWADNVVYGLGSGWHWDRRLDAKIAYYLMSIPSVKTVEIGGGGNYAQSRGSQSHDAIYFSKGRSKLGLKNCFFRKSNNAGGIEGGISNGETIVVRIAAKPIPTLLNPLSSVNLSTKKVEKAIVERSDICVIGALGVIAESMLAIALTEAFLDKFGSDTLKEIMRNYKNYVKANF
ncbi:MAG: chorismate synthase [Candidatus Omnitrophica bacterium]|nr:chorismate synthase [Candidatus Omnitrophota bacterium]